MTLVPRRLQQVQRRPARLAGLERDGSVPLYAECYGEPPTWDRLPPELRRWVDASLPASGQFDASYAPVDGSGTVIAWGTLPGALSVLSAVKRSSGSDAPNWTARATIVSPPRAQLKRATLAAVAPTVAGSDEKEASQTLASSVFSNLPTVVQRAIEQAVPVQTSELGYVLFTWERGPTELVVTQDLWYRRHAEDWNLAGAYARRSVRLPGNHDEETAMRSLANSTTAWSTVAFRAEVDWSYGVAAAVNTSGYTVLPLHHASNTHPQLPR